ncbi:MAG: hypothetical protein ACRDLO_04145, partial [Solirubrobacterales bacterium]
MDVRRALAWSFAAVIVAAGGPLVALEAATGANSIGSAGDWLLFGAVIASAVVGLLLALRRPANPIGWLLLTNALVVAVGGLAKAYPGYALSNDESLPGIRLAAAWYTWGWPTLFAPIVAIALIFPDGRLPSARWRKVVIGGAISFAVVVVTGMLWDGERLDAPFESIPPYAVIPDEIAAPLHNLGLLGMIATIVLAAVALVSRFRGADGVLRLQLKWIAYAGTLVPIAIIAGTVDGVVLGNDPGLLTELPFALAMAAIPTAIGIAVLRYRLYEIDRLINATLVYGALTALLAIAFAGVSLGLGVALGGGSTVPTAVATLAVVLAFRPLRDRIQLLVDRRFNRA